MFEIVTDSSLPGLTRASSRQSPVTRFVRVGLVRTELVLGSCFI